MLSDTQEGKICCAKSSRSASVKRQNIHQLSPPLLLPELRVEWVRKGIGRMGIEKMEKGRSA